MKDGLAYDHDTLKSLSQLLERKVKDLDRAIRFNFIEVIGPKVVINAKKNGSYKDRTSNLRSSIGFILVKDGKIIRRGGFQQASGGSESGDNGIKEGEKYATELAKNASDGYTLIVVAGMNYARPVESKGFYVLSRSEKYLQKEVNDMIERVLKKAGFK